MKAVYKMLNGGIHIAFDCRGLAIDDTDFCPQKFIRDRIVDVLLDSLDVLSRDDNFVNVFLIGVEFIKNVLENGKAGYTFESFQGIALSHFRGRNDDIHE